MIISLATLVAAACADRTTPTSGPLASSSLTGSIPEQIDHPDDRPFTELALVAPSHGGLYFDTLTGDLTVYLKDLSQGPAAKRALSLLLSDALARARTKHPHAGIVLKQGTYTFVELARWRDTLDAFLMETRSAQWWGIDHANNRIDIGVLSGADSGAIVAMALDLAIPAGALRFERTGRILDKNTLQDSIRPVEGGIRIARPISGVPGICTFGFPALRGGQHAFVTASHCSTQRGRLDSTKWYQNRAPLTHADSLAISSIGFEVADSSMICRFSVPCGYADASVYRATLGPGGWYFGRIARPVSGCLPSCTPPVLTIDPMRPSWSIVRTDTAIYVGQLVSKIGEKTGWTQSYVRAIGQKVFTDWGTYSDQAFADFGVGDGDSGAPVLFDILGGTDTTVTLGGLLWGQTPDSVYAIFSPWKQILKIYPGLRVN